MKSRLVVPVVVVTSCLVAYFLWRAARSEKAPAGIALAGAVPADVNRTIVQLQVQVSQLEKELRTIKRDRLFLGLSQPNHVSAKANEQELDV
jgi:hypothetical protein